MAEVAILIAVTIVAFQAALLTVIGCKLVILGNALRDSLTMMRTGDSNDESARSIGG